MGIKPSNFGSTGTKWLRESMLRLMKLLKLVELVSWKAIAAMTYIPALLLDAFPT